MPQHQEVTKWQKAAEQVILPVIAEFNEKRPADNQISVRLVDHSTTSFYSEDGATDTCKYELTRPRAPLVSAEKRPRLAKLLSALPIPPRSPEVIGTLIAYEQILHAAFTAFGYRGNTNTLELQTPSGKRVLKVDADTSADFDDRINIVATKSSLKSAIAKAEENKLICLTR